MATKHTPLRESINSAFPGAQPNQIGAPFAAKWAFVREKFRALARQFISRNAHPTFFFFTLVTSPRRSLSLKLSDTRVYEPQIRARLGTKTHFCEVVCTPQRRVAERTPHRSNRTKSESSL